MSDTIPLTLQNFLTALAVILTLIGVWGSLSSRLTKIETTMKMDRERRDEQHAENKLSLEDLKDRVQTLEDRD